MYETHLNKTHIMGENLLSYLYMFHTCFTCMTFTICQTYELFFSHNHYCQIVAQEIYDDILGLLSKSI